jgi:tRNA(fMet)-specific endonuclease VapC
MADKIILVDTSILIDYYRKTDKEKSVWISLVRQEYSFAISAVTKYEIYSGATSSQLTFWDSVLQAIAVIPFDEISVDVAITINNALKKKRKQIDIADLFIAATAIAHNLQLATLNKKHFERIDTLKILG